MCRPCFPVCSLPCLPEPQQSLVTLICLVIPSWPLDSGLTVLMFGGIHFSFVVCNGWVVGLYVWGDGRRGQVGL